MKRFLVLIALAVGIQAVSAAGRATEILEKLAAGFRAMPGYSVDFEVVAGDYNSRGSYVVEGRNYYLALADAEVFADSVIRYEIDNRRREPQYPEQSRPGFRFPRQRVCPDAGLRSRGPRRRAADARCRERLSGG